MVNRCRAFMKEGPGPLLRKSFKLKLFLGCGLMSLLAKLIHGKANREH